MHRRWQLPLKAWVNKYLPEDVRYNVHRLLTQIVEHLLFDVIGVVMAQLPPSRPRPNRRRGEPLLPSWAVGALVALFIVSTVLAAYLVFTSVRDFVSAWQITGNPSGPNLSGGETGGNTDGGQNSNGGSGGPISIVPEKWTGTDRVTILLLGIDRRVGDTETAFRTDSIMIVSVDPVAKTGVMLSVPRDLWVEIPDYGADTINTANFKGDAYAYPGGGPALAVKTVENNIGVDVDYYVRLDFTAFEKLVDAISGIEIDNPADIADPEYPDGAYGFEPFYLSAGRHQLNGHDALRYARTRHQSSDVDRARRQQQVVLAVRDKVTSLNMLPTLISQTPGLYQTLNESIQTNLDLGQIISLALLANDIPRASIQSAVIDYQYLLEYQFITPEGTPRQVLVPIKDKLRELVQGLFTAPAVLASPIQASAEAMVAEGARVQVLNGSGVPGLAGTTSEWLRTKNVNVLEPGNADRTDYASTVIIDYTNKPNTSLWLAKLFGVSNVVAGNNPSSPVDVAVIVGQNWQVP